MHYTGTIWRPPYEADSLLIEATAGCTHHRCKFCTLYNNLPFRFRMSPLEDIEEDLREAQMLAHTPLGKLENRLFDRAERTFRRVYLTGGNPFVLETGRLTAIAELVRKYFPSVSTIGCFARVTDISQKTDAELEQLRALGYDGLTIGVETGDREALAFMNKGYGPEDVLEQCRRLDRANIRYAFFYLTGISGTNRGEEGAKASAELFNRLHPWLVGTSMLTIYPDSQLFQEIQAGNWREAGELEKLRELRTLAERLTIPTVFAALGASNAIPFQAELPRERGALLTAIDRAMEEYGETELRAYRTSLPHL